MQTTLGRSDVRVSTCCLGTMTFGAMSDEPTAHAILDRYVALGGNFIDVAEMYPVPCKPEWAGTSEEIVGRWLAARGSARDGLVIATKVAGPRYGGDGAAVVASREKALTGAAGDVAAKGDYSRAQIRRACEASLARLQCGVIDLYQLHWPERYMPIWGESQYKRASEEADATRVLQGFDEIVTTIGELIREGKIRQWGLSNETSFGVCAFVEACKRLGVPPPVSIQNDFGLLYRTFESELAEACSPKNHGLSLLAYGVLNGGALSGKYLPAADAPAEPTARFNFVKTIGAAGFQARYRSELANQAIEEYVAIAKAAGLSAATLAQAWAYSRSYMGAVIIGATSIEQLEANWAAATVRLSDEALAEIDAVHVRIRNPNLSD